MDKTATMLLTVMALVIVAGLAYWYGTTASVVPTPTTTVEYDGEFSTAGLPEDVSGTDLQVETAYAESNNQATITLNVTTDMNASANAINGNTWYLAYRFKINGPVEDLDVDGTMNSSLTDECETRRAYLLKDEKGVTMDVDNAIATFDVDSDQADFDGSTGPLDKGEYVLVIEMKTVSVSGSIDGSELYSVDTDLDTTGDVDKLTATIEA